jgi:hypothetical protein
LRWEKEVRWQQTALKERATEANSLLRLPMSEPRYLGCCFFARLPGGRTWFWQRSGSCCRLKPFGRLSGLQQVLLFNSRPSQLEEYFAVMLARLKRPKRDTYRLSLWRAVSEIEAPIVLRAFNEPAFDEPIGQVCAAVRAEAIRGEKRSFRGAVNSVSLAGMIETDYILRLEKPADANLDPAVHYPPLGC